MIDFLLLALIAVACLAFASKFERDKIWLMLPTGFVAIVVLRVISVVITAPVVRAIPQLKTADFWLFVAALLAICISSFAWLKTQWKLAAVAVASAAAIMFGSRVIGLSTLTHGDSIWILTMSEYISRGGDPAYLGTQMSLKRGFSLILMIGLGKDLPRLDEVLPIVFVLVALITVGLAWYLLKNYSSRIRLISISAVTLLVFTAWLPWVTVFYVNGHTLVALGIMVSVSSMLIDKKSFKNPTSRVVTFCLGLALVTLTRPEGIVLSLILVALFAGYGALSARSVLFSVGSVFAAFLAWMGTVNAYIVSWNRIGLVSVAMLVGLAILALGLYRVPKFVHKVFWLTPWILAGLFAVMAVVFAEQLARGEAALAINLLFFEGKWGFIIWAMLLVVAISLFVLREAAYSLMLRVLVSMGVASLLSKMLDGGITGQPTLGRVGWVDSLNRMWIHILGILVVILVLGVAQLLTNKFVGFHLRSKPLEDSHNAAEQE